MNIISRMKCVLTEDKVAEFGAKNVHLAPVYSDDPNDPNYSFSQATPSGELKFWVTNPAAYDDFEVGKVYDITISPVASEEAATTEEHPTETAA